MKKLFKSIILTVACLLCTSMSFAQKNFSLQNDWNWFSKRYHQIIDVKSNPNDGIYYLEREYIPVPYVQDGDTLYGTTDGAMYLRKMSFVGDTVWTRKFIPNDVFGIPQSIRIISDGIIGLCDWGICKIDFLGNDVFQTLFSDMLFDKNGFFGGTNEHPDYMYDEVFETQKKICVLGHIIHCDSSKCYYDKYVFTRISLEGKIIDTIKIARGTDIHFVQDKENMFFAYLQDSNTIMIKRLNLESKKQSLVMNGFFGLQSWNINKIISMYKVKDGFKLITSSLKEWDWEYNQNYIPTNYFVEVDTIESTMSANEYTQQNTKLLPCLDEWTTSVQVEDTLFVSTEDGKLIKWATYDDFHAFDLLGPKEKMYGTARIALLGRDKLLYITNDSILTTLDSIVGNMTYYTEYKATVVNVLDLGLNFLAKDTLPEYASGQMVVPIDSNSFCFSGWLNQNSTCVISHWKLWGQITNIKNSKKSDKTFNAFPNPCSSLLNIQTDNSCTISMYDITGMKICERYVEKGQSAFDTSSLAKGMYIVQTSNGMNKKILKQ